MAKKQKKLVRNIQDLEKELLEAKRKLIKSIDTDKTLTGRYDALSTHDLIIEDRQWSISNSEKALSLSNNLKYNDSEVITQDGDKKDKMLIVRGEDYTLVGILQLGDCGYYRDYYILKNKNEI